MHLCIYTKNIFSLEKLFGVYYNFYKSSAHLFLRFCKILERHKWRGKDFHENQDTYLIISHFLSGVLPDVV